MSSRACAEERRPSSDVHKSDGGLKAGGQGAVTNFRSFYELVAKTQASACRPDDATPSNLMSVSLRRDKVDPSLATLFLTSSPVLADTCRFSEVAKERAEASLLFFHPRGLVATDAAEGVFVLVHAVSKNRATWKLSLFPKEHQPLCMRMSRR